MNLIYRGTLSPQVVESVLGMLNKYPCVVEIDPVQWQNFWEAFLEWSKTAMPKYTITINSGSSGEDYQTDRVLYGLVSKDDGTDDRFMFFKTIAEKKLFVDRFGGVVKSIEPFQTILER